MLTTALRGARGPAPREHPQSGAIPARSRNPVDRHRRGSGASPPRAFVGGAATIDGVAVIELGEPAGCADSCSPARLWRSGVRAANGRRRGRMPSCSCGSRVSRSPSCRASWRPVEPTAGLAGRRRAARGRARGRARCRSAGCARCRMWSAIVLTAGALAMGARTLAVATFASSEAAVITAGFGALCRRSRHDLDDRAPF